MTCTCIRTSNGVGGLETLECDHCRHLADLDQQIETENEMKDKVTAADELAYLDILARQLAEVTA